MPTRQVLPRLSVSDAALQQWANRLVDVVQRALDDLSSPPKVGIALTGTVAVSAFNPTTATAPQTAQALATMLQAFQKSGRVA